MRIAVDTLFETPRAGTGGLTYLISLVEAMARMAGDDEIVIFASAANRGYFDAVEGVEVIIAGSSNESRLRRIWAQQARLGRLARDHGCDVFFGAGNSVPLVGSLPSVVVLHSLKFLTQPGQPDWLRASYRRAMVGLSCAKATRIISVSQFTEDVLLAWKPQVAAKSRVVLEGVGRGFDASVRVGDDPYCAVHDQGARLVLFASTLWPFKDLEVCIRALASWRGPHRIHLAVCGGDFKGEQTRLTDLANRLGVADRVSFLGHLPQAEMPRMYAWSDCFVYPSREEWFGLPLLEAMASGVPVLAARTSCLPEVAGDAALFFGPGDSDGLAGLMEAVLTDDDARASLVQKGIDRARSLSWDKCAAETLAVLREAVVAGQRPRTEDEGAAL